MVADVELGQPDMASANADNAGVSRTFNLHSDWWGDGGGVSSDGTRFYVADLHNHRVLIWNTIPTANDAPANVVVGQPDMTSTGSGLMAFVPSAYSDGTRLYAVDNHHNRVLIWNTIPTANGVSPDVVVGQPDMTTYSGGSDSQHLSDPMSVYSDGTRLYVVDQGNSRVLIWNSIPTANGVAASVVVGQPDMTSDTRALNSQNLNWPNSVYSRQHQALCRRWRYNRVLIWNTIPTGNGAAANVVLGQPDMTTSNYNTDSISLYGPVRSMAMEPSFMSRIPVTTASWFGIQSQR